MARKQAQNVGICAACDHESSSLYLESAQRLGKKIFSLTHSHAVRIFHAKTKRG